MSRIVHLIFCLLLVNLPLEAVSQPVVWNTLKTGRYGETIRLCDSLLQLESVSSKHLILGLKSRALLHSYRLEEYLSTVKQAARLDSNTVRARILLLARIAEYYQYGLRTDSTLHFANLAMKSLRQDPKLIDDSSKSYVYAIYGNSMRNGHRIDPYLKEHHGDSKLRNQYLMSYLDTALLYAVNDEQRADIYLKAGTLYSDRVWGYRKDKSEETAGFADLSIDYLNKAIALLQSPTRIAHTYSLIGLNHHYMLRFDKADEAFKQAKQILDSSHTKETPEEYLSITNWQGRNYELRYEYEGGVELLKKADSTYRTALGVWKRIIEQSGQNGMNDGYRVAPTNKLAATNSTLFRETGDSTYLFEAFKFSDLSKYPTMDVPPVSLDQLQECLGDSQVFVQWFISIGPKVNMAFVISKQKVWLLETERAECSGLWFEKLNGTLGINEFKKASFETYKRYFSSVDSLLRTIGVKELIISHNDECSWLNLDVLIDDTVATTWKDQPYLFKRYQISYALSGRSFVDADKKASPDQLKRVGVSVGRYDGQVSLRFSEELTQRLEKDYVVARMGFRENIQNSNMALCFSHGFGSLNNRHSQILTSTNDTISVSDIYEMTLSNDFVMLTACNTNSSTSYRSEGAVGNFSKALRYAGTKSTLTTSWEIDERSNSIITDRLVFHLSEGLGKNKALWLAKWDYWNGATTDEEFNPMYWSPYILTGNLTPVTIKKRETNHKWLWFLLVIPIGFFGWWRFR